MKTLQKITSVFLAIVFLSAGLGLTISKMVCLKSGKTMVSLSGIEDCCVKKEALTIISNTSCCDDIEIVQSVTFIEKGHCCDINNTTFNLSDFQSTQKLNIDQPSAVQSLIYNPGSLSGSHSTQKALSYSFADLPPPRFGRLLLSFISILII